MNPSSVPEALQKAEVSNDSGFPPRLAKAPADAVNYHLDLREIPEYMLNRVKSAINQSRTNIMGVLADETGQLILPSIEPAEEITIPEDAVESFVQDANTDLGGSGVSFEVDEEKKLIRATARYEREDPQQAIGYDR